MHKPSSFISSITLVAFLQAQIASVWALPAAVPEQKPAPTLLYLGDDPYTQALLKLQYDGTTNSLEWQLINNGLVLTSQSHALPEATESVDSAVVYDGDQIIVAGRTSSQKWFIRALNSQGEYQWQRSGEGRVYDLAFSEDGETLYAVGRSVNAPLFMVVDAVSGDVQFHASPNTSGESTKFTYSQVVVSTDGVIIANHNPNKGLLQLSKWKQVVNSNTENFQWQEEGEFCKQCEKENVTAVALQKYNNISGAFLCVTTNGFNIVIEQKDSTYGSTVYKVSPDKWSGAITWKRVLNLDTHHNQSTLEDLSLEIDLSDTIQFITTKNNCSLTLAMKEKSMQIVNLCRNIKHNFSRRSLLESSSSDSDNITWPNNTPTDDMRSHEERAFRVLIEWIGGLIGVIGGLGIITAVIGGGWTLYKKCKNISDKTLNNEHSRRNRENDFIKRLLRVEPQLSFQMHSPDASSTTPLYLPHRATYEKLKEKEASLPAGVMRQCELLSSTLDYRGHVERAFIAVKKGEQKTVEDSVKENPRVVHETDEHGNTLLHYAASSSAISELVSYLLVHQADPSIVNNEGFLPLHLAMMAVNPDNQYVLDLLLDSCPLTDEDISLLFHLAVQINSQHSDIIVNKMLKRNLHERLKFFGFDKWKKVKYEGKKQYDSQGVNGVTILHEASVRGSYTLVESLSTIINVNYRDDRGNTPLHFAAMNGNLNAVKALVRSGRADANIKNKDGWYPIQYAILRKHSAVVHYLLKPNEDDTTMRRVNMPPIDLRVKTPSGLSLLHLACATPLGGAITIDLLKEKDPSFFEEIDEESGTRATVLHHAASVEKTFQSVESIITKMKSKPRFQDWIDQEDSNGDTSAHVAMRHKNIEVLAVLHNHGASFDKKNHENKKVQDIAEELGYKSHLDNVLSKKVRVAPPKPSRPLRGFYRLDDQK